MAIITNDATFHALIGNAVKSAISDVMDKIFEELRNAVESDIYGAYSPSDYDRTNELLTSWEKQARGMVASIEFKPEWLTSDPAGFHHNSPYGWDVRDQILDILESGYGAYHFHKGKPIPSRPMWDKFIAKVDSHFKVWMIRALRANGLDVI